MGRNATKADLQVASHEFEEVKRMQGNPEKQEEDNPEGEGDLEEEEEEGLAKGPSHHSLRKRKMPSPALSPLEE